jgi:hypothetical protein
MRVWRWTGKDWQQFGTILSLVRMTLRSPELGMDGDGFPFLSWTEAQADNSQKVCYSRWSGDAWAPEKCLDGNAGPATSANYDRAMALGSDGTVFMVWPEGHGTPDNRMDLYLHRYNN